MIFRSFFNLSLSFFKVFVATVSPARVEAADYIAWGHSSVVNPWGEVIAKAGHDEEIIYADLDLVEFNCIDYLW